MDKLTAIKIKYDDGTYSDEIPVSVLSENVEWDNTHTLVDVLGSIDVDVTGTIQDQISQLFNEKVSATQLQNYVASQLNEDVSSWLNTNVNPVGSAVVVDSSLTISGAAADAKKTGDEISDLKKAEYPFLVYVKKPDISTENNTLTIYAGGSFVIGNKRYYPTRTETDHIVLDLSVATSQKKKILFNKSTVSFRVVNWDVNADMTDDDVVFCVLSIESGNYLLSCNFDYTINGKDPVFTGDVLSKYDNAISELESIRVDNRGMTHTHAGDAVRGQINNVEDEIKILGTQDIINLYRAEEETGFVQSDGTVASNGSWANYLTGTIVLDAGTYTIYGYTQSYTVSGSRYGIAIINGGKVETYKNAYLTDNKEVITLVGRRTIKISATSDVKKMVTKGDGILPYESYDPRFVFSEDLSHQLSHCVYDVKFEIGSIADPGGVPAFVDDTYRVRTAEPIELTSGDVIGLTDYTKAEYCVFWQNELGGYANTAFYLREDYVVRFSGKYWVCIRGIPETRVVQMSQLWGLFKVVKSGNEFGATIKKTNAIIGVNHRGFSANKRFPENTLIAFKASKLFGFDEVETDVAFTSDNVPVLLHDATINRTARNADGTEISSTIDIGTITYEQALQYDFGLYAQSAYAGTKIPTLEEFISLCKNINIHPHIELKDNGGVEYDQSLILGLIDLADSYDMGSNVTWTSFNANYLRWISAYKPDASLLLTVYTVTERVIEIITDELMTGKNTVILATQSYTDAEVELCRNAKIPMCVYTINTSEKMDAIPTYATYVTSDTINASEYFYNKNISLT